MRPIFHRLPPPSEAAIYPDIPALEDDHPLNEYYLLRRFFPPRRCQPEVAAVR